MKKIIATGKYRMMLWLITFSAVVSACNGPKEVIVEYEASGTVSSYRLDYLDEQGEMHRLTVKPKSAEDVWRYRMVAEQGDILYLSGKYQDVESLLRLTVKVEGKIYKEAFSKGDTVKILVVSGVIPYD